MEQLLRIEDVAKKLRTYPGVAAAELAKFGVYPIDFGAGKGRGQRWLDSAVEQALSEMHKAAQPEEKTPRKKMPRPQKVGLASMNVDAIFDLTHAPCVQ